MPAYVPLSEKYDSTDGISERRFAFAAEVSARPLKLRYDGIAIAVRIPRMITTTSSSIRVKPRSSRAIRFRSLFSICDSFQWERWLRCVIDAPREGAQHSKEGDSFERR